MFDKIMSLLGDSINSCLEWLMSLWSSIGEAKVIVAFITFFTLFTFVRLVLLPLLGFGVSNGASDRVTRTDTTTYTPRKTADGQTWYEAKSSYTVSRTKSSRK